MSYIEEIAERFFKAFQQFAGESGVIFFSLFKDLQFHSFAIGKLSRLFHGVLMSLKDGQFETSHEKL